MGAELAHKRSCRDETSHIHRKDSDEHRPVLRENAHQDDCKSCSKQRPHDAVDRFGKNHALGRAYQYEKTCSHAGRRAELKRKGNIVADGQSHPNLERKERCASRPWQAKAIETMFAVCRALFYNCRRHLHLTCTSEVDFV